VRALCGPGLNGPGWPALPPLLWRGSVPMWLKGLTLEGEIVRNPSVSLSPTLDRNEKV